MGASSNLSSDNPLHTDISRAFPPAKFMLVPQAQFNFTRKNPDLSQESRHPNLLLLPQKVPAFSRDGTKIKPLQLVLGCSLVLSKANPRFGNLADDDVLDRVQTIWVKESTLLAIAGSTHLLKDTYVSLGGIWKTTNGEKGLVEGDYLVSCNNISDNTP